MTQITGARKLSNEDVHAIHDTIEPWSTACMEADWDALLDMCTEDVVFMPPGEPAVEGSAVRPWLEEFPTIKSMTWDIDHLEGEGDLAVLRGWTHMVMEESAEEIEFRGKYTDLCRCQADGSWRCALVIWNSDEPA